MEYRTYGAQPPTLVVVHGGPGAAGEVAPVAQELAARGHGVLEPLQSERSVVGQIAELRRAIEHAGAPPVTLIGHSWGAWLACLLAARHPMLVARLILVASGPFEARDAEAIPATRLSRLTAEERAELTRASARLDDPVQIERVMHLFEKTDSFAPVAEPKPEVRFDKTVFDAVWAEADALRRSGELLRTLAAIHCPVVAIHGDYDPHPAEGVERPLRARLPGARFVCLSRCGHTPWREAHARDAFYRELTRAID